MAPPTSSHSLYEKFLKLVETLQFAWFVGHLTLLLSITSYGFSYLTFNYYSTTARLSYRTAFLSAAATYGIVVYKAFRARARITGKPVMSPITLAADENVQYLGNPPAMALVWLWSNHYPLAMLPFGIYSVFHVATYTRTILVPTFQKSSSNESSSPKVSQKPNTLANTIGHFVKQYYDASMGLVAILEIALWGRIFLSAIVFSKGSWMILIIYTIFLRARYAQSTFVQTQFRYLEARIDSLVGAQSTPPTVRQAWDTLKGFLRAFHDATNMKKHLVTGSSAAKRAA